MSDLLFKHLSFAQPMSEASTPTVCASDLSSVLRKWREPGCYLALWQRSLAPDIVRRLDRLEPHDLPAARFVCTREEAGRRIAAALASLSAKDRVLQTALSHDMAHLVSLFAAATSSERVDVRIEAVSDDACRRFHTDVTLARLVTTYVGPATVWVPPRNAAEALEQQERYTGPLFQMPRFAVGMFPGEHSPGGGLVHRSPRLSGTGQHRLFFCLNQPQSYH